jgi:hypothetical protein
MNFNKKYFFVIFLFIALVFIELIYTISGLNHIFSSTLSVILKHKTDLFMSAGIFAAILLAFSALLKIYKINLITVLALSILFISLITGNIFPFLATLWFSFSSYLLGKFLLKNIPFLTKSKVPSVFSIVLGIGFLGLITSLAVHFPINYPGFYALTLCIPILFFHKFKRDVQSDLKSILSAGWNSWHYFLIGILLILFFILALMPEIGYDALSFHLFVPSYVYFHHMWGFDVLNYTWAVMPMLGDFLYTFGYMLSGEVGSRLINFGLIFLLGLVIKELTNLIGGSLNGARWALLLFFSSSLTFLECSSLYIESSMALFLLSGTYMFLAYKWGKLPASYLYLSAIFFGFATQAKAPSLLFLASLFIYSLITYSSWINKKNIKHILFASFLFIFIGIIPYAYAWFKTGNPLFPFYNSFFKSHYYPFMDKKNLLYYAKGISWDFLYRITFHTRDYLEARPGGAGLYWILFFIPTFLTLFILKKSRLNALFFIAAFGLLIVSFAEAYLRYMYPQILLFFIVSAVTICMTSKRNDLKWLDSILTCLILVVLLFNLIFLKFASYYGELSLTPLLSQADKKAYLDKKMPIRNAIQLVNELNVEKTAVFIFADPLAAGLQSEALFLYWGNIQLNNRVAELRTNKDAYDLLKEKNVDFIIVDEKWETTKDGEINSFDSSEKRELFKSVTDLIFKREAIEIRRLRKDI